MKVGDYVRYKNGEIEKIHSFAEKDNPLFNILINARYHNTNEIKKYGKLIDLIEVGDYVNGVLVESIYQREKDKLYIHSFDTEIMMCFTNNNIKTIVTKEQFESMEYKL